MTTKPTGEADLRAGDAVLWCMIVLGPNEVHAAPDFWTALAWSTELNAAIAERAATQNWAADDNYPHTQATVGQWSGSAEEHANALRKELAERADHEARRNAALATPPAREVEGLRALANALDEARRTTDPGSPENMQARFSFHIASAEYVRTHVLAATPDPKAGSASPVASAVDGEGLAETAVLVDRFATALKAKLRAAEAKYGWQNGWAKPDWADDCRRDLTRHVGKGDPLDVAAYAAFCWHHGWSTTPPPANPATRVAGLDRVSRLDDCCSAAKPCSNQKRDPYSLCEVCEKAHGLSSAALATPAATALEGFVLVPREPTEEMVQAAWNNAPSGHARGTWSAMLAASPPPPGGSGEGRRFDDVSPPDALYAWLLRHYEEPDPTKGEAFRPEARKLVAALGEFVSNAMPSNHKDGATDGGERV